MDEFKRVEQIAKDKGWTLREVESKAGISPKSLYNWKRSSPKLENVEKVANALNVPVDALLGNNERKQQDFFQIDISDVPLDERDQLLEDLMDLKKKLTRNMPK